MAHLIETMAGGVPMTIMVETEREGINIMSVYALLQLLEKLGIVDYP